MASIGYVINEAVETPSEMTVLSDKNNRLTIETIFQDFEVKNRNGRFYSTKDFAPQLKCERTQELLRTKNFFGEAGHPMTSELSRQQTIDLNNIAHSIQSFSLEGDILRGVTKGTPNAQGELFNNLIMEGTIPSFSLRALGSVDNTRRGAEVKNIRLITYDWVVFPSHKKAYMEKILKESAYDYDVYKDIQRLDSDIDNKLIMQESASDGIFAPITNQSVIDYVKTESTNLNIVKNSLDFIYDNISIIENGSKVLLSDNLGTSMVINLENYISNEIMNYCYKL